MKKTLYMLFSWSCLLRLVVASKRKQKQAVTSRGKEEQATTSRDKQEKTRASCGKPRQTRENKNKPRQAAASKRKQEQAATSERWRCCGFLLLTTACHGLFFLFFFLFYFFSLIFSFFPIFFSSWSPSPSLLGLRSPCRGFTKVSWAIFCRLCTGEVRHCSPKRVWWVWEVMGTSGRCKFFVPSVPIPVQSRDF